MCAGNLLDSKDGAEIVEDCLHGLQSTPLFSIIIVGVVCVCIRILCDVKVSMQHLLMNEIKLGKSLREETIEFCVKRINF